MLIWWLALPVLVWGWRQQGLKWPACGLGSIALTLLLPQLTTASAALLILGLGYFAGADWQSRSVPAPWFDGWGILTVVLAPHLQWGIGLAWLITLLILRWWSQALGSADILAMTVVAVVLPPLVTMGAILAACVTGFAHHAWRHPETIPFLSHLFVGVFVCMQISLLWALWLTAGLLI